MHSCNALGSRDGQRFDEFCERRIRIPPDSDAGGDALPPPLDVRAPKLARTLPAGRVEETLARISADVLGAKTIGRDDNFFDLGGHSLLTVQVHRRIRRELGARHPTVRALAGFLEGSAPDAKVEVARAKERGTLRGAALRRGRVLGGEGN